MEVRKFSEYEIAEISSDVKARISDLEVDLSSKSSKDIVLIAYQAKNKAKD